MAPQEHFWAVMSKTGQHKSMLSQVKPIYNHFKANVANVHAPKTVVRNYFDPFVFSDSSVEKLPEKQTLEQQPETRLCSSLSWVIKISIALLSDLK